MNVASFLEGVLQIAEKTFEVRQAEGAEKASRFDRIRLEEAAYSLDPTIDRIAFEGRA